MIDKDQRGHQAEKGTGMPTHAEVAARLMRDAAVFYRTVGSQNQAMKEQMEENAAVFERVADLLEKDPTGMLVDNPLEDDRETTIDPGTDDDHCRIAEIRLSGLFCSKMNYAHLDHSRASRVGPSGAKRVAAGQPRASGQELARCLRMDRETAHQEGWPAAGKGPCAAMGLVSVPQRRKEATGPAGIPLFLPPC